MSKILVALWSYDSSSRYGRQAADVLSELRKNVARCRAQLASVGSRRTTSLQAIFVAPEYLFTAPNNANVRVAMSSAQKDLIEQSLRELSRQYASILIFAGTVFYQEELIGAARGRMGGGLISNELQLKRDYVKAFRPNENLSGVQIAKVDLEKDLNDGKVVWATLTQARKQEFNFFWDSMYSWDHRGMNVPGLVELAAALKKGDSSTLPQRRARNCAYVFLGGQRVAAYDKHSDFTETRGARPDKLAFLPGTADQAPDVDGLRFGVEICFDHANGVLKRRGLGDLDFHVVVSDCVGTVAGNMAMKRGGYFLHASSNPAETMVVSRAPNGVLTAMPLKPPADENTLSFCEIDSPK